MKSLWYSYITQTILACIEYKLKNIQIYVKTSGIISAEAGNNGNFGCGWSTPFNLPVANQIKNLIIT